MYFLPFTPAHRGFLGLGELSGFPSNFVWPEVEGFATEELVPLSPGVGFGVLLGVLR